jgi:DNA-binding transcriptional MerR regulator
MKNYLLLATLSLLVGCSAFKEQTGEFVTEAVVDHITQKVDDLLEKRGLSVAEIRTVLDDNGDQTIDRTEILDSAKETAKDVALLEAQRLVEQQIAENSKKMVNATDLEKQKYELWNWILGLVAAYLGKQIYSAKQDSRRDQKLAVVEKLLNRDIDGDGKIGGNGNGNGNGNGDHPATA